MTARRTGFHRGLTVMLTGILALTWAATPAVADPDDEIGNIEDQIEQEATDLGGIVEEYNAINLELSETKAAIKKLEKKLAPFNEELQELYDSTEGLATAAYKQQGLGDFSMFVTAGTPDKFVDRMTMLNGVSAQAAEVINEIIDKKAKYDDDLSVLEDLKATQADAEAQLAEQKEKIQSTIDQLQQDRRDLFGPDAGYVPDYIPGDRGRVVSHALAQRGKPYEWSAAGPDYYDCSGLMLDAYRQIGISMPHLASAQYNMSTHISRDELQPGDLVFYNGLEHVAMYIGDGYVVHAPTYGVPVRVDTIDAAATPYYGAGRFIWP